MSILDDLSKPFPADRISWRVGSVTKDGSKGMALAYLDARDVMQRLDEVCGTSWQCRYSHAEQKTVCEIGIKIGGEWLWRSNGAGDSDIEAEKGALSDAFKRAAVLWGVGRYLYDMPSPWVELEGEGKFKRIKPSEMGKLNALLERGGAKPQSSAQAKAEDSWKRLMAGLRTATEQRMVQSFTTDEGVVKTVSHWPDKWRSAWAERVEQALAMSGETAQQAAE